MENNTEFEEIQCGENRGESSEPMAVSAFSTKRYYVAITSLLVALAILLTFVITYVIMSVSHKDEIEALKGQHDDYIGEFSSIINMYNSLPSELRNIETYKKLAYIDAYYRTEPNVEVK